MHVLFLDEFGHPDSFRRQGSTSQYNPTFGYGGFTMPAEAYSAFATNFFDIKARACRNLLIRKWADQPEHEAVLIHLKGLKGAAAYQDEKLRQLNALHEVKGSEIFSRSYAHKLAKAKDAEVPGSARKLRAFFRYAKLFLRTLHDCGGEIIYCGVDKRSLVGSDGQRPHLGMLKWSMRLAEQVARANRTTISVYFDRHHLDNDVKAKDGSVITLGRVSRIRNMVSDGGMYEFITDPVLMHPSHESQGVQAADWICYLLSQVMPYRCGPSWKKYELFAREFEPVINRYASPLSWFRLASGDIISAKIQGELALPPGRGNPPRPGKRPYHSR